MPKSNIERIDMNKIITGLCVLLIATALAACTDTQRSHSGAYGDTARVTCYSGGRLIADDFSTGKVSNASQSDGYELRSKTTNRLVQFTGDCVVDYGATPPAGWTATLPETTPTITTMVLPVDQD